MKVVIAGSRTITSKKALNDAIQASGYNITEVVSGKAFGVDTLGENWAIQNNVSIKQMPAQWNQHGRAAGPIRNRQMAEYSDAAIILWDGESPGTKNMIKEMQRLKKPYYLQMVFVHDNNN